MEHRIGQRSCCRLSVVLYTRDGRSIRGEIQDISAGGAFIRVVDEVAAPHGLVRLEFETHFPAKMPCNWWSLVVRQCDTGIGVMFDQRHNETAACRMRPPIANVEHSLSA